MREESGQRKYEVKTTIVTCYEDQISGLIHTHSDVRTGPNWEGRNVVEVKFSDGNYISNIVIDRITAIRLRDQLRAALEEDES